MSESGPAGPHCEASFQGKAPPAASCAAATCMHVSGFLVSFPQLATVSMLSTDDPCQINPKPFLPVLITD